MEEFHTCSVSRIAKTFFTGLGFEIVKHMTLPLSVDCDFPCNVMRRWE
jgi:hypothetical protein